MAERMSEALGLDCDPYRDAYDRIRKSLFYAVHRVHVQQDALSTAMLCKLGEYLLTREVVFTTNYDLLNYWALMAQTTGKKWLDYFWSSGFTFDLNNTDVLGYRPVPMRLYYLHGALHLYHTLDGITTKMVWSLSGSIIDQIYTHQPRERVPLFVSEGSSTEKMSSILRSDYLSFAYRELSNFTESLIVFGHRLDESDKHLVDAIARHRGRPVAISVYDQDSDEIVRTKSRYHLGFGAGANLYFFDSRTHPLGDPALRVR